MVTHSLLDLEKKSHAVKYNESMVVGMGVRNGTKSMTHVDSICNRQNVCGGPKKAGLGNSVGIYLVVNPQLIRAKQSLYRDRCNPDPRNNHQPQQTGYHAMHNPFN